MHKIAFSFPFGHYSSWELIPCFLRIRAEPTIKPGTLVVPAAGSNAGSSKTGTTNLGEQVYFQGTNFGFK